MQADQLSLRLSMLLQQSPVFVCEVVMQVVVSLGLANIHDNLQFLRPEIEIDANDLTGRVVFQYGPEVSNSAKTTFRAWFKQPRADK